MSSRAFGAFIDIEDGPKQITNPPAALKKVSNPPATFELDEMNWGARYNGPRSEGQTPHTGAQTPKTPNELEMSRPPSPRQDEAASLMQTWRNPAKNQWRVLSTCVMFLGMGMSDSAIGALIPYMETHYHIGYAVVSIVFVTYAVGFLAAAFVTDALLQKFGRAKALMAMEILLIVGYVMLLCTPPYGVVLAAFFLMGLGYGVHLALNNVFIANLAHSTPIFGAAHGSYGVGGMIGPIISTAMVSKGFIWSRFYVVVLAIRVICFFFAGWAFWGLEREAATQLLSALERTATNRAAAEAGEPTKFQLLKQAVKNRVTLMGALFIFAYQGAEVATSGWVISFLISYRDGDPAKVGYVSAGFWAGITLGRFILTHFCHRFGERTSVYILGAGAIVFQLLVWLVPNIVGDAVAVTILGLLLGPVYPCGQTIFSRLLPHQIHMMSIGFIASAGSSGGAVAPFTIGLAAQAVGTFVMHPICIGLFVVMLVCFASLPRVRKRTE